jgi:hypothetical protein
MMNMWKKFALAMGLLFAISTAADASILDRMEAGRRQIKGWGPPPRAMAGGRTVRPSRTYSTAPQVASTPRRVRYSPAFQEGSDVVAAPAVSGGRATTAPSRGAATHSNFSPSHKGTYRNSR